MISFSDKNKTIVVGYDEIPIQGAPNLVRRHLRVYPGTIELELDGYNLIKSYFNSEKLIKFINDVCNWGRYSGISGRVLRNNTIEEIQVRFADALDILNADYSDVSLALKQIIKINGLSISFGSKHLRFIRPDICSILDSIISEELSYPLDTNGFKKYTSDCIEIGLILERERIINPMNRGGRWFAGDVDMVVFAHINRW